MRDGFAFEPIDVEVHPEERGKYRILDGVHRWHAYKSLGANEIDVHVFHLLKIKRTFRFFNSLTLNRVCINHCGSDIAMAQ